MKQNQVCLFYRLLWGFLLCLLPGCHSIPVPTAEPMLTFVAGEEGAYPSAYVKLCNKSTNQMGKRFVLERVDDLRAEFCSEAALNRRITNKFCAVDFTWDILGTPKDIKLTPETDIGKVLDHAAIGYSHWEGQSQIRLITRDTIIQSPRGKVKDPKGAIDEFRKMRVSPGDIIIIGYRCRYVDLKPQWPTRMAKFDPLNRLVSIESGTSISSRYLLRTSPADRTVREFWQRMAQYPQTHTFPMPGGDIQIFFDDSGRTVGYHPNIQL